MRPVKVGDVLEIRKRPVEIDVSANYTLIGIYSFGKGIFHREPQLGVDLGSYKFSAVMAGDLVLSNIQSWEGAIGLATEADRGTVGTHRFLSYVALDPDEIDTNWARYYFLGPVGFPLIQKASPGSVTRNRTLSRARFEAIEIPLPDIAEQRRIAAHLDRVAGSVASVEVHRGNRKPMLTAAHGSVLHTAFEESGPLTQISEVASVHRGVGPRYLPDSEAMCINQGCIQWQGMNLSRGRPVDRLWEAEVSDEKRVQAGDVLVNSTGEGTIGRSCLPGDSIGLPFDSHVLAVRPDPGALRPAFLNLYIRSPQGQAAIESVKGANTTKQTELGKKKLEAIEVPVPDTAVQDRTVSQLSKSLGLLDRVNKLVAESDALGAAVLASALNRAFAGMA